MKINKTALTTVLGVILGALVLANVDYGKLLAGDKPEIGKAIAAVVVAIYGWLTKGNDQEASATTK